MARPATTNPTLAGTQTLTLDAPPSPPPAAAAATAPETVVLRLRRPAKKVSWKEGTVDNEFLNRKSSKKCCIFHKEKPFDEDDSDDDGGDGRRPADDGAGPSGCCSHDH